MCGVSACMYLINSGCKLHPSASKMLGGPKNGKFDDGETLEATIKVGCVVAGDKKRRKRAAAEAPEDLEFPIEVR